MVNMMGKEMGRTCRAAHSALLRRVVGRRLQSFAVGWGCPSHWTRLPSLLSANMRLPLGIVDYYQADESITVVVQRFSQFYPAGAQVCAFCVQSEAVLQHIELDRNFFNNAAPSSSSLPF